MGGMVRFVGGVMQPLSLDDVMPLEEFVEQRQEFFTAHLRYLDRYRRIRLGPRLTLLFENRQTLWFRVQEVLRVARLDEPTRVQQELDWYNQLLPTRNRLQAALLITVPESEGMMEEIRFWRYFTGSELKLCLDSLSISAQLLTAREADYSIGLAHWLEFPIDRAERELLADVHRPLRLAVRYRTYVYQSAPLSAEIRQSLLDDLALSDRDPTG